MNSDDAHDSAWENRIAAAYRTSPAPLDDIWREAVKRSSRARRHRLSRFAVEIATAVAFAVLLVGVIGLPRLLEHSSNPRGSVASTQPTAGTTSAQPAALTCTLPISVPSTPSAATDGFLRVDTGVYTPAAAGANGEAYARALGKWIPVTAHLVAPDGSSYMYVDARITGSALHFVDRHQDRLVVASAGPILVLGFVSLQSVAYSAPDANGRLTTWLLDTTTLQSTTVSKDRLYDWAGGGAIWRVGPAARGSGSALYRLDVRTGAETIWFDVDGYLGPEPSQSPSFTSEGEAHTPQNSLHHNFGIIGFDASGHPVVQLGSPGDAGASATLLITSPQTVQTIVVPGANGPGHLVPESATGGHSALWMVDAGGHVAVYRGAGPLEIIANVPVPAGSKAELAGPCS